MGEACRHVPGAASPDLIAGADQPEPTDGQRIATELASIRELLEMIAGALFQIAGDASEGEQAGVDKVQTYMDGAPI